MAGDFNSASANGGRQTVDADGGCLLAYSIAPQQKATNARRRPYIIRVVKKSYRFGETQVYTRFKAPVDGKHGFEVRENTSFTKHSLRFSTSSHHGRCCFVALLKWFSLALGLGF